MNSVCVVLLLQRKPQRLWLYMYYLLLYYKILTILIVNTLATDDASSGFVMSYPVSNNA